jgi:TonB family protein
MKKIFTIAACLIISAVAFGQDAPKETEPQSNVQTVPVQPASTIRPAYAPPAATATTTATEKDSSQNTGGVYQIGRDITKPQVIHSVNPEFTDEARRDQFEGVVLVGLIVDAQGHPQNVHVIKAIGHGLDANAVAAVKQYKFKPATKNGVAVPVQLIIYVNFRVFR